MKIAIVGTGISGLSAAYHLCREHDLVVFEQDGRIGGHTHTMRVTSSDGEVGVDTGFIVYNEENYPQFSRLLCELGVASKPTSMSFSVTDEASGFEYGAGGFSRIFAHARNAVSPAFYGMLADVLRFQSVARKSLESGSLTGTVLEFCQAHRLGRKFLEHHLRPMGASLWSCAPGEFEDFPIRFVVEFLANHSMLHLKGRPTWRVLDGGSSAYLAPMTRPFRDRIRLGVEVLSVRRAPTHVEIVTSEGSEIFDEVILACHSDQALSVLCDPSSTEQEILGSLPYQDNEVVLHTDTKMLPRSRRAWAAWNYFIPARGSDLVQVTYNMNILQGIRSDETYCVTLNRSREIDPAKVLRRLRYAHPVATLRGETARKRRSELLRRNRTSFCGAYFGFGFHEDGVRSALDVVQTFRGALALQR